MEKIMKKLLVGFAVIMVLYCIEPSVIQAFTPKYVILHISMDLKDGVVVKHNGPSIKEQMYEARAWYYRLVYRIDCIAVGLSAAAAIATFIWVMPDVKKQFGKKADGETGITLHTI
jgi:hypothetical protein